MHMLHASGKSLKPMGLKGKIKLVTQPPNSPDTNVNDLGFFRALQSLAWKKTAADVPQLINNGKYCSIQYEEKLVDDKCDDDDF